jgi:pyruvate-formate lyase-activating enzyme
MVNMILYQRRLSVSLLTFHPSHEMKSKFTDMVGSIEDVKSKAEQMAKEYVWSLLVWYMNVRVLTIPK